MERVEKIKNDRFEKSCKRKKTKEVGDRLGKDNGQRGLTVLDSHYIVNDAILREEGNLRRGFEGR